jgi:hypothetical protein
MDIGYFLELECGFLSNSHICSSPKKKKMSIIGKFFSYLCYLCLEFKDFLRKSWKIFESLKDISIPFKIT